LVEKKGVKKIDFLANKSYVGIRILKCSFIVAFAFFGVILFIPMGCPWKIAKARKMLLFCAQEHCVKFTKLATFPFFVIWGVLFVLPFGPSRV